MNRHHARMRAFLLAFVCLVGVSTATPARAGSIVVEPGSFAGGYLPLSLFGLGVQTVPSDGLVNFTLPDFVFAGQTFNQVSMAENGYAVLGGAAADAGLNQSLPDSTLPNAILAPFWTDLSGGELRVGILTDSVDDWFVMDWMGVTMAGGATTSFEIWIGLNGVEDITFAYGSLGLALPSTGLLTIGAEDPAGLFGMNYFYNGIGTVPTGDLRVHSNGPVPEPTPVPEPATMTLLGAGLAMSAIARRRSARRK